MRTVALLVSIVLLMAGFPSAQGAATVVRLGTVIPAGTIWNSILKEQSAEWSRLTAGRVRLVVMSGTQGDEDAIIRKMRTSGQLQAASLSAVSLAMSIDQSFNVFFIPMFYQDYAELAHVMDKLEPLIKQRLADKGFVFVNWGSGGWVQVFSKKPAKNLRELKAMKLFTSAGDDLTVQWYKANGFQPVPLSSADMLSSLTTGMIEAVPVTPLSALSFQWYKSTPYMLDVGISPLVGATVVTRKAWDAISEADRAQLMAAAQKTEVALPHGSAAHRRGVDRRDAEERPDGRQGRPGRPGRVPHRRRWLRQDDARRHGAARCLRACRARARRLSQAAVDRQVSGAIPAGIERPHGPLARVLYPLEDALAGIALAVMVVLPLAEIVLRRMFGIGIPGSIPFVQHLVLWVGFLGAALAAREGTMLALATGTFLPDGRVREIAAMLAATVAAAVSAMLCAGAYQLMMSEREAGTVIAAGVTTWMAQTVLPLAFGLIAIRTVRSAGSTWAARPWRRAGSSWARGWSGVPRRCRQARSGRWSPWCWWPPPAARRSSSCWADWRSCCSWPMGSGHRRSSSRPISWR